ncbi:MAG: 50S ribosomal protein L18 [Chloroflexia bacterium]|nr:50S ribosomal protein L18 [Chloroflexia bacterium]
MAVRKARELRLRRHNRVRRKVDGTSARPRLSVFRSSAHIYAQIIDDVAQRTLVAVSSQSDGVAQGTKSVEAHSVGQMIAAKAKAAGINQVVFDRGGFKYHGRVQALADGAREGGLEF